MIRLLFALMWLVHFLPLGVLARLGNLAGSAMYWLVPERRRVIRVNLEKCFPQMPPRAREALARAHFRIFFRSFLERAILWWAPRRRIERLVRIEGLEHLQAARGRPAVIFAPHFVGFDATITRLSWEAPIAVMYSRQKNRVFDALLHHGRARFGGRLFPRQAGLKAGFAAMAEGAFFYYMPDMDFGRKHSIFVPFFGVPAATVTALSFIARTTGAQVIPCVTRMLPGGQGYVARLYPAWRDFPGSDDAADARRMLGFIEERVLEMPEQYYWLHKRFKTRPAGEPRPY